MNVHDGRSGDSCSDPCPDIQGCQRDQLAFSITGPREVNQLQTSVNAINALSGAGALTIAPKLLKTWSGRGESNPRVKLGKLAFYR